VPQAGPCGDSVVVVREVVVVVVVGGAAVVVVVVGATVVLVVSAMTVVVVAEEEVVLVLVVSPATVVVVSEAAVVLVVVVLVVVDVSDCAEDVPPVTSRTRSPTLGIRPQRTAARPDRRARLIPPATGCGPGSAVCLAPQAEPAVCGRRS
jgi:hypothetical protein